MATYLTAHELRDIAARTAAAVLPIETAVMLPVPIRAKSGLVVLVVYFRETGPRTRRVVEPPTHAMRIDPVTGKVLHFGATTPERLGIPRPAPKVAGAGIAPGMTGLEFAHKRDRLLDISRDVWTAYAAGSTAVDPATRALASEYADLFLHITKAEVASFYVGVAPDFFQWVRAVAGVP